MHQILSALGEASRIQIIGWLSSGPKTVGSIAQMSKIQMVNVSHHLGLLNTVKIVISERRGRYVYYHLNPDLCSVTDEGVFIKHTKGHVFLKIKT